MARRQAVDIQQKLFAADFLLVDLYHALRTRLGCGLLLTCFAYSPMLLVIMQECIKGVVMAKGKVTHLTAWLHDKA